MTIAEKDLRASTRTEGVRGRNACIIVGLLFCNLFVFSQAVTFEFLMWDDEKYVVRHIERLGGLSATTVQWSVTNHENGWRTPLPYLSLFTDATLFGLNPAGYHLTNLLIHTASTVLLFLALRSMTRQSWTSAGAAALFAIHPLHVEPVAWVTGRWELLCGFFWILGMLAYVWYCRRPSALRMAAVVIAFVGSLASKPMALTLPFALLLLDYWPIQRLWPQARSDNDGQAAFPQVKLWQAIMEKAPLFACTVVGLWIAFSAKSAYLADQGIVKFSWGLRIANALQTYTIYAGQLFWPSNLSFYHLHPGLRGGVTSWQVFAAGAVLLVVSSVALYSARKWPGLLVGWLWYLGVFVPAIGLVQVEYHARAERYTYLPLIGLLLIVCWGVARIVHWLPRHRLLLGTLCVGALTALMIVAHRETTHWRNNRRLFEHALRVDPQNYKALLNLGVLSEREGDLEKAESYCRRVLEFLPGQSTANFNLGTALYRKGAIDEAILQLQRAARIAPGMLKARYALAACYDAQGNAAAAEQQYLIAIDLRPQASQPYSRYADYLARSGQFEAAVTPYREALRRGSHDSHLAPRLGAALVSAGHGAEAVRFYASYYKDHPERVDVADKLAWLLATHDESEVRDSARAIQIARHLCELSNYENQFTLDTLAAAYADADRFPEATATVRSAIELAAAGRDKQHHAALKQRLVLYRQSLPYREPRFGKQQDGTTAARPTNEGKS